MVKVDKFFRVVNCSSFTLVKFNTPQRTQANEDVNVVLKVFCINIIGGVQRSRLLRRPHTEQ